MKETISEQNTAKHISNGSLISTIYPEPAFDEVATHVTSIQINVYAGRSDVETAGCVQIVKPPMRIASRR